MTRVVAIDPGLTTGFAIWDRGMQAQKQDDDPINFCRRLDVWLSAWSGETAVVIERFIINVQTISKSQAPWSLEIIGAARYLAHKHGAVFEMQSPSDAKSMFTDTRLKKLGWWQKGLPHANDATRHLGLYIVKMRIIDPADVM